MAINQNHISEEINSIKCAVVETHVSQERMQFLTELLRYNGYHVEVAPTPPPKATPAKPAVDGEMPASVPEPLPATFTVAVTDLMFNPINAIFGRLLHTPQGQVVTLAYWQQKEKTSRDEIPYFEKNR